MQKTQADMLILGPEMILSRNADLGPGRARTVGLIDHVLRAVQLAQRDEVREGAGNRSIDVILGDLVGIERFLQVRLVVAVTLEVAAAF